MNPYTETEEELKIVQVLRVLKGSPEYFIGDRVVCIDDTDALNNIKLNAIYTISGTKSIGAGVLRLNHVKYYWNKRRFKPYQLLWNPMI